jgi:tetratricopeptide (TPR) repeat protein
MGSFMLCTGSLVFSADESIIKQIKLLDKQQVTQLAAAGKSLQEMQREAEQQYREKEAKKRESQRMAEEQREQGERALQAGRDALIRGNYESGVAELEKSWGFGVARALGHLAWHFAACKDANQHNGKRAIELALKHMNMNHNTLHKQWALEILAAAYARNGQFDEAVKIQMEAVSMWRYQPGVEERLKLYRQGRPCQEK